MLALPVCDSGPPFLSGVESPWPLNDHPMSL